jgi:short-subunit dehydrogenase
MRPARPQDGIAWITGGSSGIGLALAETLLAEGWQVGLTARRRDSMDRLAVAHPGRVFVAPGDVAEAAAMRAAVEQIEHGSGRKVALAIMAAGCSQRMGAADFDLAAFRRVVLVNLLGTANCLDAVMPAMIQRGRGQIAIIASIAGYVGLPNAAAYSATKAALISLAQSLRFDLPRAGVLLQVVNPGFVRTPMTEANDFPMPDLLEVDDAVTRIIRGLNTTRFEIAFPTRPVVALKILRLLPYALFFALLSRAATMGRKG